MRILNYNEPYVVRDIISGPIDEGNLNLPRDISILDIGCGTGVFGRLLGQQGYKDMIGIDGSEHQLKVANQSGNYKETRCMWLG